MGRMKKCISICSIFALALTLQFTVSVQAATQSSQFTISGPVTAYNGEGMLDPLGNGMVCIMLGDNIPGGNARYGLMDSTGKVIISPAYQALRPFKDGLSLVQSGSKCGFINPQGKVVVPITYDSANDFNGGFAIVQSGGKYGLINTSGKLVLPIKYDKIGDYSEGLIGVVLNGKAGFVDNTGKIVIPMAFEDCDNFSEGLAGVSQGGKWGFIDKTGKVVIPMLYNYVYEFSDGFTQACEPDTGYLIELDKTGANTTVTGKSGVYAKYEFVDTFSDGIAMVQQGDKCGFTDKNGNLIVPIEYDAAAPFIEGMGTVIKDGKHGFVNTSGQITVPIIYDDSMFFSEGYVTVMSGEKEGMVDKNGTVILPCEYNYVSPVLGGIVVMQKDNKFYIGVAPKAPASPAPASPAPPAGISATPTASKVLVNGTDISFDAYSINGSNYFKLRDLAKVISGTGKQFEVTWDGTKNAINLVSGKSYTQVGGELAKGDGKVKTPVLSTSKIYVDGAEAALTAYNIGGNNYFKLRDVMQKFNVGVGWDGTRNTITIDTSIGYTP